MTPEERFTFAAERFMLRDHEVRSHQRAAREVIKGHDGEEVCRFSEAPLEQWCDMCREFDWNEKRRAMGRRSSAKTAMRKWWKRMNGAALESTPGGAV